MLINKRQIENEITDSLYNFSIQDWKSTALISDRRNMEHKQLKKCIGECVEIGMDRFKYWFSPSIIDHYHENIILNKNNKLSHQKTATDISNKLIFILNTERKSGNWDFQTFSKYTVKELIKKFNNIEQLRPYFWEQYSIDEKITPQIKNYNNERKSFFGGEDMPENYGMPFYERVSLENVYNNFKNNSISRAESFFGAVIAYTLCIVEIKNTQELTRKINKLSNEITINELNKEFEFVKDYTFKKLNFEIEIEQAQKKEEIKNALIKLKGS